MRSPEGITETREEGGGSIFVNNSFGYGCAESGHPFRKPLGDSATMKRKVCDSGASHELIDLAPYSPSRTNVPFMIWPESRGRVAMPLPVVESHAEQKITTERDLPNWGYQPYSFSKQISPAMSEGNVEPAVFPLK